VNRLGLSFLIRRPPAEAPGAVCVFQRGALRIYAFDMGSSIPFKPTTRAGIVGGAVDSTGLRKSRPGGVLRTVLYLIIVFGSKVLELKGICSFTMAT
jgi:hypothetical protein